MKTLMRPLTLFILVIIIGAAALWLYMSNHGMHHGDMHDHMTDANGNIIHDEANMPGLVGVDTTDQEIEELRALFLQHQDLTRTVENLPDGIRTITETDNKELREKMISHALGMMERIKENRDPEVIIASPMVSNLFDNSQNIFTYISFTEKGIVITQTSDNPDTVEALQQHAAEVSELAERGMEAVHERMEGGH